VRTSLLLLSLALVATPALAKTKAGVTMPDELEVAGHHLILNGLGIREATMLKVDVYVAGLYVEAKSGDGNAISGNGTSKRLVMHFVRDVDRDDIAEAFSDGFEKVLGEDGAKKMEPRIKQLVAATRDMKKGEKLSFSYVPDVGTTLDVNGKASAPIPGADFAKAIFAIWLGKSPPNSGLKEGLLGKD